MGRDGLTTACAEGDERQDKEVGTTSEIGDLVKLHCKPVF